jgi:hypothetical protein
MRFVKLKVEESDVLRSLSYINVIFVLVMRILIQVIPG